MRGAYPNWFKADSLDDLRKRMTGMTVIASGVVDPNPTPVGERPVIVLSDPAQLADAP